MNELEEELIDYIKQVCAASRSHPRRIHSFIAASNPYLISYDLSKKRYKICVQSDKMPNELVSSDKEEIIQFILSKSDKFQ